MKKLTVTWQTIGIYILGHAILAVGLMLNTNSRLGVSPVMSVAFNFSEVSGIRLSNAIFFYSLLLIAVQFGLLKKKFDRFQVLQVVAAFLGSAFLEVAEIFIPVPDSMVWKAVFLVIGITLVGIGASLTVAMKIFSHPADATAHTIGVVTHQSFGFGKNVLDAVCITLALAIGFAFGKGPLGVNIGTVCAMIFTGRVIALCHPFSEKLYQKYSKRLSQKGPEALSNPDKNEV